MSSKPSIPWVEQYRPIHFDSIVISPSNKKMLNNIIEQNYFPNIIFYGPPGTGKTTTILNLISKYQEKYNEKNKDLIIHLNASDERGIETIRNQINQFVNSKNMFSKGMKFVILDEVDYMTKIAQQALRYLLQNYSKTVRFCLICNYICKIEEGLQNEFLKIRFNELPKKEIIDFLQNISEKEKMGLTTQTLETIQTLFKSDIRSMINYMQTNQGILDENINIVTKEVWSHLLEIIQKDTKKKIKERITELSILYNIDVKNIIKDVVSYLIRTYIDKITSEHLTMIEYIIHNNDCCVDNYVSFFIKEMKIILSFL